MNDFLKSDIRFVAGVGESREKLFNKLSVFKVIDLIFFYPRAYEDRTKIKKITDVENDESVCIIATVISDCIEHKIKKELSIFKFFVKDETGQATISFFNQKFIANTIKKGNTYVFFGKVSVMGFKIEMTNPIFEADCNDNIYTKKIVPIYPLTASLTQKVFIKVMQAAIKKIDNNLNETLPNWVRNENNLCELNFAINNIHFPKDMKSYEIARKRLVFEELFMLQTALLFLKNRREKLITTPFLSDIKIDSFINNLPFKLTNAQNKVIDEIIKDTQKSKPMNRLIQGDVGSGKTVVAAVSIFLAIKNGFQAALMVPTEILARQHFESFKKLFEKENIKIELLIGSTTAKNKKEITEKAKNGEIDLIIGTHALIQSQVEFKSLGLVVTDEQHRFGVRQRAILEAKGNNPHTIIMTATPIPRTLALILYGDLDISIIDELPPGRQKIETYAVDDTKRERVYNFIKQQINEGRQIYIICPLVDENDEIKGLKAVTEYSEKLQNEIFNSFKVSLIHGKLKAKEKEKIMNEFIDKNINILVSTTVIEVGINVPNATVMIIENAERFGLSQLHQLRGRVGRGAYKSYCILFNNTNGEVAKKRMEIMAKTTDGFKISEKDLEIRGPGEFFGMRQHGLPELKIANLFEDLDILKLSQNSANKLMETDKYLKNEQNKMVLENILKIFEKGNNEISFN